jgi:hypothetical protein
VITVGLRRPPRRNFDEFRKQGIQVLEQRALKRTDEAARNALRSLRAQMSGAGLGRLGNALTSGSDMKKGGRVERMGAEGFRVSGWIVVRTRNERALGAIEAYTEGTDIRPVRGRWLWIATDDIPSRVGRHRMTPKRYRDGGFEQKIGKLEYVRSVNGYPLLVVRNVGISTVGKSRSAKSLRKNGQPRKGQRAKEFLVAFIGIPHTVRAQRVDARSVIKAEADALGPAIFRGM